VSGKTDPPPPDHKIARELAANIIERALAGWFRRAVVGAPPESSITREASRATISPAPPSSIPRRRSSAVHCHPTPRADTFRHMTLVRTDDVHAGASSAVREERLIEWLRTRAPVAIGFSGGVDSAYLACVALEALGVESTLAIIGRSPSYPREQWAIARGVAERFGVPVLELDTDEMNDPRYAANPSNRCYFCKTELWSKLVPAAHDRGMSTIVDGTNADDLADWRPGAQAALEHGVLSPLAVLGFTKQEIRERSRARGIPTWSQPSSPCLSSRIPYGTPVTVERLRQVEIAEQRLREIGVTGDLRVRHHGTIARIEMQRGEIARWLEANAVTRVKRAVSEAGFDRVAIDLRGFRSGSLNILGGVVQSDDASGGA
jgi:pyridinium-3,5-biscarboxylic acid mononucleotide sulfurtransferase